MKKLLLLSLAVTFGLTTFAQRLNVSKDAICTKSSVNENVSYDGRNSVSELPNIQTMAPKATTTTFYENLEESIVATTYYDLQSNGALSNRLYVWPDGTIASTITMGMEASSFADRGTGYNYFNGTDWNEQPATRVEPLRSGWPSIAPYGANGEILVSHNANGVSWYTRENKGEGEWVDHGAFANANLTWPRIATSGPNNEYIHIMAAEQDASNTALNYVYYMRSTDGGETWSEPAYPPLVDVEGIYNFNFGADCYTMASSGNTIAILFNDQWADLFVIKSTDNGETWEKIMIWEHPFPNFSESATLVNDSLRTTDGTGSCAIDENGMVHVVWGCGCVMNDDITDGSTSYWAAFNNGVGYWNESMGQIPTGYDPFHTMENVHLDSLGMMAGYFYLTDPEVGIGNYEVVAYGRGQGACSNPSIAIDENGSIAVVWSAVDTKRIADETNFYRSLFASYRDGIYGTWYNIPEESMDYLWNEAFIHMYDEAWSVSACPVGYNGDFYFSYSADMAVGDAVTESSPSYGVYGENYNYVMKLTPGVVGISEDINVINYVENAYPNPASEKVNFNISLSQKSDNVQVSMHNIAGQLVYSDVRSLSAGNGVLEINTSNLQSGVYFCTISVNNHKETKKVIIK